MAIFTLPIARVADDNFRVGAGYKLHFYDAGTTNERDTYTDNTYTTTNANPVVADGNGRFAVIWTSGDYKVVLKTAADDTVWTVDNYSTDSGSTVYAQSVLSADGSAADVITASLSTTPGSLTDGLQVVVELQHGANTIGNPTFNLNSLGAKTIVRDDDKPLRAGDTGGDGAKIYLAYSSNKDAWVLLNPSKPSSGLGLRWVNGLAVTNGTDANHDIDIAVGQILDSTESVTLELNSSFTKQIDNTFAVGTGLGGLSDQDTLAIDTYYGVFLIGQADGETDVIYATTQAKALADTVASAAGFTYARLIGYVLTDGSSNIIQWVDGGGDLKLWSVQVYGGTIAPTTRASRTVQCPPFQTANLSCGLAMGSLGGAASVYGIITSLSQADTAPAFQMYTLAAHTDGVAQGEDSCLIDVKTNGSSQVGIRVDNGTNTNFLIFSRGWRMDYSITDLV